LPVPLSPSSSTVLAPRAATFRSSDTADVIGDDWPMISCGTLHISAPSCVDVAAFFRHAHASSHGRT
jgi:hypothetical protein